ncbi:MAG: nucleotidyltransferase family protein [Rectinemataceae bacterium]
MRSTLLVLAAGMGSRFGGIKQLEPVGPGGETLLEYSVYDALRAGFNDLVFLIRGSMEADFRERVLSRLPAWVQPSLAFQEVEDLLDAAALEAAGLLPGTLRADGLPPRSKPWGTGHALLCAATFLRTPFAIINADDWYGREALAAVWGFLETADPGGMDHCMAGYRLSLTTRGNGQVARGLCEIDAGGRLLSVREHRGIERRGERCVSVLPDGRETEIASDTLVSMNLWGFTPAILGYARPLLASFLAGNAASATAEFYLPSIVSSMIEGGQGSVQILPSSEQWMGMTWRGDLGTLRSRIAQLVASGAYPSPLWPLLPEPESPSPPRL